MKRFRFLIDKNTSRTLADQLRRLAPDIDVLLVGDEGAPPRGTLDPEILRWCEEQDFLLVTNNRKSMPEHLAAHLEAGKHVPGILELNPKMNVGETIEELLLIWGASDSSEYQDVIVYLPLS